METLFYFKVVGSLCDLTFLRLISVEATNQSRYLEKHNVMTKYTNFLFKPGEVEQEFGGREAQKTLEKLRAHHKHNPKQNIL